MTRSLAFFLLLLACSTADVRNTLGAIERAQLEAVKAFDSFDREFQLAVAENYSYDEGKAKLAEYRKRRLEVYGLFVTVKNLLASGQAVVGLVEAGTADRKEFDLWLSSVVAASMKVRAALAELMQWATI